MTKRSHRGGIRRRDILRAVPLVIAGSAIAAVGRFVVACSDEVKVPPRNMGGTGGTARPTDDDELVRPEGDEIPVDAGETPPVVPNPVWEARARQLEDEQLRLYGPVFTTEAPGVMIGKDRSHVPVATALVEKALKRVTVLVQHVMDKNGLDAGYVDSGDAGMADAADAADARDGAAEAGDAGAVVEAGTPQKHYITTVYLRGDVNGTNTVVGLWEFASTDAAPPSVKFTLPAGLTSVVAYEWCTLHGLWKAAPLGV